MSQSDSHRSLLCAGCGLFYAAEEARFSCCRRVPLLSSRFTELLIASHAAERSGFTVFFSFLHGLLHDYGFVGTDSHFLGERGDVLDGELFCGAVSSLFLDRRAPGRGSL